MVRNRMMKQVVAYGVGTFLLCSLPGCLATRGWVTEQLSPLDSRLSGVEGRVGSMEGRMSDAEGRLTQVEAKADKALANFDHLQLQRRFVLSLKDGATFTPGSDNLTAEARHQIDGFLSDLDRTDDVVFLVAGHTDNTGSESRNYTLGQRRAAAVARYLIAQRGIDPIHVSTMSYGSNAPIAKNDTAAGREKNRRVEILVYRETITASAPPKTAAY